MKYTVLILFLMTGCGSLGLPDRYSYSCTRLGKEYTTVQNDYNKVKKIPGGPLENSIDIGPSTDEQNTCMVHTNILVFN